MHTLNAQFVRSGGLVFDVGAHVGDRVASFRRLGARVVAVEPQPAAMRALRLMFHRDPGVILVPAAVGAAAGTVRLYLNTQNPTVSTASTDFMAAAADAPLWRQERWDRAIDAPAVTLDDLVAEHGVPDFVKIDVEGCEAQAVAGLSQPLPSLSFEFTTIQRDEALKTLALLVRLGEYVFNVSIGERHALEAPVWMSAESLAAVVKEVPEELNSGDIYARHCQTHLL